MKKKVRNINKNHYKNRKIQVCIEGECFFIQEKFFMKRVITKREEQAYRLCHHDFDGLRIENAATAMSVTSDSIRRFLHSAEHKAPQLFPIFTPEQLMVIDMYNKGDSCENIADVLGISIYALRRCVAFLRKHRRLWDRPDQFDPARHEDQVKEKF